LVTHYIMQSDTFCVTAGVADAAVEPTWIGTGTSSTSGNPNPFYSTFWGNKTQFLVTADELVAAGFSAGNIMSIGFDVLGISAFALNNFTIKMGQTTDAALTTTFVEGMTEVYTIPVYNVVANSVNDFEFATPFPWDGVSNIVVEACFNNSSWGGSHTIRYTNTGFNSSHYYYADISTVCGTASAGYTSFNRPNMLFDIVSGCESPRVPVVASIHPDPIVDLGDDKNMCVDSGTLVVLDAVLQPNSPVFEWDNGVTSQVRAVGESGTYYVSVTNQWGCASGDTVNILLRENPKVDLGNDTTVCK